MQMTPTSLCLWMFDPPTIPSSSLHRLLWTSITNIFVICQKNKHNPYKNIFLLKSNVVLLYGNVIFRRQGCIWNSPRLNSWASFIYIYMLPLDEIQTVHKKWTWSPCMSPISLANGCWPSLL